MCSALGLLFSMSSFLPSQFHSLRQSLQFKNKPTTSSHLSHCTLLVAICNLEKILKCKPLHCCQCQLIVYSFHKLALLLNYCVLKSTEAHCVLTRLLLLLLLLCPWWWAQIAHRDDNSQRHPSSGAEFLGSPRRRHLISFSAPADLQTVHQRSHTDRQTEATIAVVHPIHSSSSSSNHSHSHLSLICLCSARLCSNLNDWMTACLNDGHTNTVCSDSYHKAYRWRRERGSKRRHTSLF